MTKTASHRSQHSSKLDGAKPTTSTARYSPKIDPVAKSMSGRAGRLLGRAGAARFQGRTGPDGKQVTKGPGSIPKAPEQMVFEGYRASSKQSRAAEAGGSGRKQGKPRTRSSRRGAEFKAKGGKKPGIRA